MPTTTRITERTLLLVRAATDLLELIGESVKLSPHPNGRLQRGHCPQNPVRHPDEPYDLEVRLRPAGGAYYCNRCGRGGDVFGWVMDRRGLTFAGAVEYLAERAGIPVEYETKPAGPQLLARADNPPPASDSEEVLLDNGDGTGWRVNEDGWAHPTVRTADGWQDTGEESLPPDPLPHRVGDLA